VSRIADALFFLIKVAAALCLALMIVLVFGNVVLRYAASEGIASAEELSGWCLVWITYLAGLIALREHGHLGFDSFVKALPPAGRKACVVLAQLLMIVLTALFLIGGWEQTRINLETRASAFDASLGWVYGMSILFGVVGILILLNDLYRTLTGKLSVNELVMVESEGGEALGAAEAHAIKMRDHAPPGPRSGRS